MDGRGGVLGVGVGGEYDGCQKGANSIATEEILHR